MIVLESEISNKICRVGTFATSRNWRKQGVGSHNVILGWVFDQIPILLSVNEKLGCSDTMNVRNPNKLGFRMFYFSSTFRTKKINRTSEIPTYFFFTSLDPFIQKKKKSWLAELVWISDI